MTTHECQVVEETPSHTDLAQVRDGMHAFLTKYPQAFILTPEEKGSCRTWGATFVEGPDTEYTELWTVPLRAHVEDKSIVHELRGLAQLCNQDRAGAPGRPKSRALIAQGPRHGAVVDYDGPGITDEIEEAGLYELDELGLDDAPDGLSIWEGDYFFSMGYSEGYPAPGESESQPRGAFRSLTDDEWGQLRRGELFL